jgi:hypothetical protein
MTENRCPQLLVENGSKNPSSHKFLSDFNTFGIINLRNFKIEGSI